MRTTSLVRQLDGGGHFRFTGHVTRVVGMAIEAILPRARIGSLCRIEPLGSPVIHAEVVGFRDDQVLLMPLGRLAGLSVGTRVVLEATAHQTMVGDGCLGRVVDGLGRPIDGGPEIRDAEPYSPPSAPISPFARRGISTPMDLGVRAINGLMTSGEGQRLAVLAGAGVGKSTLLGMMARHTAADVAVVAMIGERGGEVQKFVKDDLFRCDVDAGRIIVVAATSDEPPAMRLRAAFTATTIAEYFRDRGQRVLLLMDSLTRVVMAQREIGLSIGEPPATRGYPPSAFALIPTLLERAGTTESGSITGIYTTLVEGDDSIADPVGDAVRATTDGHIVLSRDLAERGVYPAIDVSKSLSRSMNDLVTEEHADAARIVRGVIRDLESAEELQSLGAYRPGQQREYDAAIAAKPALRDYLTQSLDAKACFSSSVSALTELAAATAVQPAPPPAARLAKRTN
ncbi:MAG: flagellum-specific ATP synthase, partial [Bradymonadia bacterium]